MIDCYYERVLRMSRRGSSFLRCMAFGCMIIGKIKAGKIKAAVREPWKKAYCHR